MFFYFVKKLRRKLCEASFFSSNKGCEECKCNRTHIEIKSICLRREDWDHKYRAFRAFGSFFEAVPPLAELRTESWFHHRAATWIQHAVLPSQKCIKLVQRYYFLTRIAMYIHSHRSPWSWSDFTTRESFQAVLHRSLTRSSRSDNTVYDFPFRSFLILKYVTPKRNHLKQSIKWGFTSNWKSWERYKGV